MKTALSIDFWGGSIFPQSVYDFFARWIGRKRLGKIPNLLCHVLSHFCYKRICGLLCYRIYHGKRLNIIANRSFGNQKFIELLAEEPERMLNLYTKRRERIVQQYEMAARENPEYTENPEYYRIDEKTIETILGEEEPRIANYPR
jgi:hypothetical protein